MRLDWRRSGAALLAGIVAISAIPAVLADDGMWASGLLTWVLGAEALIATRWRSGLQAASGAPGVAP